LPGRPELEDAVRQAPLDQLTEPLETAAGEAPFAPPKVTADDARPLPRLAGCVGRRVGG
jgi:hypothetical protein